VTPRGRSLTSAERDEVWARYLAGEDGPTLARAYGVTKGAVYYALAVAGVKGRTTPRRYPLNEGAFDTLTPEAAYWLGFLLADGSVSDAGLLTLRLAAVDREHVERFRAFVGAGHPVTEGRNGAGV